MQPDRSILTQSSLQISQNALKSIGFHLLTAYFQRKRSCFKGNLLFSQPFWKEIQLNWPRLTFLARAFILSAHFVRCFCLIDVCLDPQEIFQKKRAPVDLKSDLFSARVWNENNLYRSLRSLFVWSMYSDTPKSHQKKRACVWFRVRFIWLIYDWSCLTDPTESFKRSACTCGIEYLYLRART